MSEQHVTQTGIRVSPALLKELGLIVVEWADSAFMLGVGSTFAKVAKAVRAAQLSAPPLDWAYPFQKLYAGEQRVLWWHDAGTGKQVFLPQVLLLDPEEAADESAIRIELLKEQFRARTTVPAGLEFYRYTSDGGRRQQFHDGKTARLVDWRPAERLLVFQGASYFDYLATNQSLDVPRAGFPPLRNELVYDGRLEELAESELANTVGINGLIFTSDGQMIFQKRLANVLVRPGELCSGFSGSVDKIDITHAVASTATMAALDAPREMVEELGVDREEIAGRVFLGITRELIRGGKPEMFYSIDLEITAAEVMARIPKDREGEIRSFGMGVCGRSILRDRDREKLPGYFPSILRDLHQSGTAELSVPLITNLVLWLQRNYPSAVGAGPLPAMTPAPPHSR
jgi:hypothetical protein